jgi:hypothetical protein
METSNVLFPSLSLNQPEKTFEIEAVGSAMPSMARGAQR